MHSFLYRGTRKGHNSETLRKIIVLNIFLFLGAVCLIIMGTIAFIQQAFPLGIIDFIISSLLLLLLYYLHRTGNESITSSCGVILLLLFFCYLFYTGGVSSTTFMWLYSFPLFSLYLLGLRRGIAATTVLFIFCTIYLIYNFFSVNADVYNRDFGIRFIPSYLLVCVLAFLVEHSRSGSRDALLNKQLLLAGTIKELQTKEKELEEARSFLEERVSKRTAELVAANKQLRLEIEERLRLVKELQRVEKMELVGRLAGGVAHDLNNVLSGIVSYPDLLLHKLDPESDMRMPLENIRRAGGRAAIIVQDLLTLARRGITVNESLQLNDIISAHLQSPEFLNLQKNHPGVAIKLQLAENLNIVSGSPVHLEKTVMNLLVNSFEAIENEGTVFIETTNKFVDSPIKGYDTTTVGNYIVLKIHDSGMGIAPDKLAHIFEPFYTSKIMGRSGTGLGMTIVWGAVKDHNGYLDVESSTEGGTIITVLLPVSDQDEIQKPGLQSTKPKSFVGSEEMILLIDDDPEQRSLGENILTTLNYKVHTVASGEEAIQYLQQNNVDLVLLDMIMDPGMDGLDTYRMILKITPNQKVVIVSGYSETNRIQKALELGVHCYVKKPYGMEELSGVIHRALTSDKSL